MMMNAELASGIFKAIWANLDESERDRFIKSNRWIKSTFIKDKKKDRLPVYERQPDNMYTVADLTLLRGSTSKEAMAIRLCTAGIKTAARLRIPNGVLKYLLYVTNNGFKPNLTLAK